MILFYLLLDFSLAKNYSARNVENRTEKLNHNDTRSMKYISLNEHNNLHLNPQQDIESMGYMLFELYWGELPWANSTDSNEVYELKKEINYYVQTFTPFSLFSTLIYHSILIFTGIT